MNFFLIIIGKSVAFISRLLNKGNGSTWPGHIALSVNKNFIKDIQKNSQTKIVLIAGTNGKTTTAKMISHVLEKSGKKVLQNTSGANLLNGIASALLLHSGSNGKTAEDFAVFEVDENALPHILEQIDPFAIILLNLFRDQLDRYGELDSITKKWKESLSKISPKTIFILNADDPQIAYLGFMSSPDGGRLKNEAMTPPGWTEKEKVFFFGLDQKATKTLSHAADSIYCPRCGTKLSYKKVYYSHLGEWKCQNCKLKRPLLNISHCHYFLSGTYNQYNTLAAVLFCRKIGISDRDIERSLETVSPAFGRQEKIIVEGKTVQIFLSKNPTSFNQSLETITSFPFPPRRGSILFVLNDRIPDGRDISWIWDIDFEKYLDTFKNIILSGDRVYDMALRLQYSSSSLLPLGEGSNSKFTVNENLKDAIKTGLEGITKDEILYILPTYSAMLEVRKILTGRKIL